MKNEKLLSARVKEAFLKTQDPSFTKEYLDVLQSNWRNATDKQDRSISIFLFLAFIFELLTRALISEVSLGPFKITNLAIIHKLIPAVMAYCFFEMIAWGTERNRIAKVYYEVINICFPAISENNLHYYLSPEGISIFGYKHRKLRSNLLQSVYEIIRTPIVLGLGLSPLIIGVYIFYQLFNLFGEGDILVWFSLISFVLIVVLAYMSGSEYTM